VLGATAAFDPNRKSDWLVKVHWAAGSDGETYFAVTSLAAPKAASSRVAKYSLTAEQVFATESLIDTTRCNVRKRSPRAATWVCSWERRSCPGRGPMSRVGYGRPAGARRQLAPAAEAMRAAMGFEWTEYRA
jgi:hypothetical protein